MLFSYIFLHSFSLSGLPWKWNTNQLARHKNQNKPKKKIPKIYPMNNVNETQNKHRIAGNFGGVQGVQTVLSPGDLQIHANVSENKTND